jgi:sulfoxide reductase heme-binding subunit YedZ
MNYLVVSRRVVFLAGLAPASLLVRDAFVGSLGINPVETITRSTGIWTLAFLLMTLGLTPLRRMTGWHWLMKFRRLLGLFAFFYATLHFSIYLGLDHFFDLDEIARDVIQRPFLTVGFFSFVLLTPLAVTSTDRMIRRLGKLWGRLHRMVYVAAIGGVVHFLWIVKADRREPLVYGAVLFFLLGYRALPRRWQPRIRAGR